MNAPAPRSHSGMLSVSLRIQARAGRTPLPPDHGTRTVTGTQTEDTRKIRHRGPFVPDGLYQDDRWLLCLVEEVLFVRRRASQATGFVITRAGAGNPPWCWPAGPGRCTSNIYRK